jgi:hypothetical protein
VLAGLSGMRHEATVAHVVDPLTGQIHHAAAPAVGQHSIHDSDYHAATSHDSDSDVCPISIALHQACDARVAQPTLATTLHVTRPAAIARAIAVAIAGVYRFAPKTSPPSLA